MEKKRGISGSTLKIIAIITMIIDHTGATILEKILVNGGMGKITNAAEMAAFMQQYRTIYIVNMILRMVGRISFPIFAFLIAEGFCKTHDAKKYFLRLAGFSLLSEIPFDLAIFGKAFYWQYQNVFFTFAIALVVLMAFQRLENNDKLNKLVRILLALVVLMAGMAIAELMKTDYGMYGVLTIVIMYVLRRNRKLQIVIGCVPLIVMSLLEAIGLFAFLPISQYNGTRGLDLKYFFYWVYPVHLLLFYFLAKCMGIL